MPKFRGKLYKRLFCVVLLCSIFVYYLYQVIHGGYIQVAFSLHNRHGDPPFDRIIESFYSSNSENLGTTTYPKDILHDWPENDVSKLSIFILSAVGLNQSTQNMTRFEVKLTGWIAWRDSESAIKCCSLLKNNKFTYYKPDIELGFNDERRLLALIQVTCPVNTSMSQVKGVALQYEDQNCPMDRQMYIMPYVLKPPQKNDTFGICLKLLYGQNIDIVNLKTWIEYYMELGVDKVFMYTYNISKTTHDVLNYYTNKGFIDKRPYDYPMKQTHQVGEVTTRYFVSEHVITYDCYRRFTGYQYIAIVDMDEFIVPNRHDNLKSMMTYLTQTYPKAAGFTLSSYIFLKDNVTLSNNSQSLPDIEKYFYRTRSLEVKGGRLKNIVIPHRIHPIRYQTHLFYPLPGYTRIKLEPSLVQLNHYRNCYSNKKDVCSESLTKDTNIQNYLTRIHNQNINLWVD